MDNCQDLATKQDLLNLYQLVNEQASRIDRLESEIERIKLEIIAITTGLVAVVAVAAAPLIAAAVAGVAAELAALSASLFGAVAVVEAEIVAVGGVASSALALAGATQAELVFVETEIVAVGGVAGSALATAAATEAQLITLGTILQGEIVAVEATAAGASLLATTAQASAGGALVLATATQGELALIESQILTLSRTPGPPGKTGLRGEKGDRGERGYDGEKGDRGERGYDGEKGDRGERGYDGEKGDRGLDGSDGSDGRDGSDGSDGRDGDRGLDGIDGKNGSNGSDGRDGSDGSDGRDGRDGSDGRDGRDGSDGRDGRDGDFSGGNEPDTCAIDLIYQDSTLTANLTVNNSSATDNVKIMEFTVIQVEKVTCESGIVKSEMISVAVLKGTEDAEKEAYEARAKMLKAQCESECIAAVPEWWQIRPEGARPQLVIHFGEPKKDGSIGMANYALTIPHFSGTKDDAKKMKLKWRKGSVEGILTLKDNSKVIVNAVSKAEAERILNYTKKYISSGMLVDSFTKIGERKGQSFKQITVAPKVARYFLQGAKSMKPNWVVKIEQE